MVTEYREVLQDKESVYGPSLPICSETSTAQNTELL